MRAQALLCMRLSFWGLCIACIAPLKAQDQPGTNFYSFLENYYRAHPYRIDPEVGKRTGHEKTYDRALISWGLSLYPHGDFRVVTNAICDYTDRFHARNGCEGEIVPAVWEAVGPTGMPADKGGGGTRGVGQIHRITFDPRYDGKTNRTLYAASMFGGLWRSTDDGMYWHVVNTDTQLPIASVSDVAVDYGDPGNIYISTGYGDGGVLFTSGPHWGNINPVFTVGMYRSRDYGETWQPINDGFLDAFRNGGTTRRLLINPDRPDQLLTAASEGVFRTDNARAESPVWTRVSDGINPLDKELRGLEFKPGDPSTVYVSGQDIYRSVNSGDHWESLTGPETGLHIADLPDFRINRINIAVTAADPDRLYAYLQGSRGPKDQQVGYIYMYKDGSWKQLHFQSSGVLSPSWLGFAASPVDADQVFFGFTHTYGSRDITRLPMIKESPYTGSGFHADVHALVFQPNVEDPQLFCANHGGVSVKDLSHKGEAGWQYRNEGLQVATVWTYDVAQHDKAVYITGNQDCGVNVTRARDSVLVWECIAGGDGYGARIADDRQRLMYYLSNTSFFRYLYDSNRSYGEMQYRPFDPVENWSRTTVPETFQVHKHPSTGNLIFGFCELYERLKPTPEEADANDPARLWRLQSDISKAFPPAWQRQITEFAIAESNPDRVYIVTGGTDNGDGAPWQLDPHLFRSGSGLSEGDYETNRFEDITARLPRAQAGNLGTPIITGIAVHPHDHKRLWLTFTGYDPDIKIWESRDGGETWSNADPDGTLANLPVNGILYQYGTDDRLYIATDAGVYVRDNTMACWQKYGNIPNVRVVELKVNKCTGRLTAGTFGRGIWEVDMLPSETVAGTFEITTDTVWSTKQYLEKNLVIRRGVTLLVKEDIYMPAGTRITVEPGARLYVDNARIANICGALWYGIDVQEETTQGRRARQRKTLRGAVLLRNGGTIENVTRARVEP